MVLLTTHANCSLNTPYTSRVGEGDRTIPHRAGRSAPEGGVRAGWQPRGDVQQFQEQPGNWCVRGARGRSENGGGIMVKSALTATARISGVLHKKTCRVPKTQPCSRSTWGRGPRPPRVPHKPRSDLKEGESVND